MSDRPDELKLELRKVVVELADVAGEQWYDLGLQLRLQPHVLDNIRATYPDIDSRKRNMLSEWLKRDPEATWEKLSCALTLTGHKTCAAKIRSQFVRVAVEVVAETAEQDEISELATIIALWLLVRCVCVCVCVEEGKLNGPHRLPACYASLIELSSHYSTHCLCYFVKELPNVS